MPENDTLPVIVIGAGTGGLTLAHGLRAAGIPVEVYERDRTRTGGLQGYRVGISPDGVRALRACLPADLFATFVATTARTPEYLNMYTEQFRELVSLRPGDYFPADPDTNVRDYSVSRMTLRQVLLTGLEDIVHFDRKFVRYEADGDTVTAHFADGSTATGRILVGADGANSPVRKQYLPHATHSETGLIGIAGKVAITDETRDLLPPKAFNGLSMLFDRRGQMGILHTMEFPWRRDRDTDGGIGGTDAELVSQWPGLLFDNTTDYLMWSVSTSHTLLPADVLDCDGPALVDLMLRENVRDWHPRFRALVGQSDPAATFALSVRTSDPLAPWQPSRVTLLGDAVHTMTPGRGAGANTALRDAALLCDTLTGARDRQADPVPAIGDYEERMRTYSAVAVRESLQFMNDSGTARKPVVGPLTTFGMRTAMRVVNRVPAAKRRMALGMQGVRDSAVQR